MKTMLRCTVTAKTSRGLKWPTWALALLLAAGTTMVVCGHQAFAQLPPLPPLPPPLPLPAPPPGLPLGPPELPTIPSLPQVLPSNAPTTSGSTELPVTSATLDAKLLVISADGTEPVLGAIRQAAEYEGIPYMLYVATRTPGGFTPAMLSDSSAHAFYQGIVLTTGSLAYLNGTTWTSAFNATEWQTLWDYQAKYRVRTAIAYALPTADLGYGPATGVDATTSPISAQLTPAGQSVFPYVNAANPIVITKAWTYLAPAAGTGTNVLLSDTQGDALALVRTYPDGRQVLSQTFDGNFFLVHSLALAHGLMNWVTGGLFLGERHIYVSPQIDDIFIDNDVYGGGTYRINAIDWSANDAWQTQKHLQAQTADLLLHMAFNGEGTTGTYNLDTLTPTAGATNFQFPWINHTFSHENLDAASYDLVYQQITRNNEVAASMGFTNYDTRALVTPDVSGLSNPEAMSAAYDAGIRFLITDTSQPGMNNPTPQAGIRNAIEPGILMVPRRPVNLYYNVTTPTEWTNEYNFIYHSYWGRDLTYDEILGKESDVLLQYLLRGEVDPWMFHQANLRAYDGVHSLLGDLLDRALEKYSGLFTLPVRSLTLAGLGEWTENRMRYDAAGVRASFVPSEGTMTITASEAAVVPVTGLCADSSEVYGGQCISHVSLAPGQTVVLRIGSTSNAASSGSTTVASVGVSERVAIQDLSPNPFTKSTTIALAIPRRAQSHLVVYDVQGRVVRTLLNRVLEAGVHPITWDGRTDAGNRVAGGVYFAKLESGGLTSVRRIAMIK
ncbi:MAG: T9SS type A sorting domain-containing protein [Candidatus Eisenbacteria bacterium]|uniref:T9SS type A sorting domain-containing protein n=1 Tax=Eiseniibacteriota bacterium TaxID=2212470 RepID=A0A538SZZ5_UNCEI|nr:MAG: T9SS type A sorting domain-containing protein [Candidatus Eisenbacteria bacterium]